MRSDKSRAIKPSWVGEALILLTLTFYPLRLGAQDSKPTKTTNAATQAADLSETGSAPYLKVRVPEPVKVSRLKPGQIIQGTLAQPVYSGKQATVSGRLQNFHDHPRRPAPPKGAGRSLAPGGESLHAAPRKLSDLRIGPDRSCGWESDSTAALARFDRPRAGTAGRGSEKTFPRLLARGFEAIYKEVSK
jgi:hypothetical protein